MKLAAALVLVMTGTAAAETDLALTMALRVGLQHTSVDKDDGAPSATGPRIEAAGTLAIGQYLSVSGVTAASWYGEDALYDGVERASYDLAVQDLWIGARFFVHPHPRVFLGLGLHIVFTNEESTLGGTESFHQATTEISAGANVAQVDAYTLQVLAHAGSYDRFYGLESVTFYGLAVGLSR